MMLCMICDDQKSELETVQKLVAGYAKRIRICFFRSLLFQSV